MVFCAHLIGGARKDYPLPVVESLLDIAEDPMTFGIGGILNLITKEGFP
jgi:hypothetical protein